MRLTFLLLLILLGGCATTGQEFTLPVEAKEVRIPKSQMTRCESLPMFERRNYSDEELTQALNKWITIHERCAAKQRVWIDVANKLSNIVIE